MRTKKHQRLFVAATGLTIASAILYCSWPLGFWLNPLASKAGLASELGAYHQPYNWVFIAGDIISGIFLVLGCALLQQLFPSGKWRKTGLALLALYGICGAIDASLPLRCLPSLQVCGPTLHDPLLIFHGIVDITGSTALIGSLLAEWLYARRYEPRWLPWIYSIGGGGVVFAGLSLLFIILHGPGYWAQRYYLVLSCVWVASIPIMFRSQHKAVLH